MAASLERPLYVVGDAEGTALGAAALGLFALGRADDLGGALAAAHGSGGRAAASGSTPTRRSPPPTAASAPRCRS